MFRSILIVLMSALGSFPPAQPVEPEERGGTPAILDAMLEERLPHSKADERSLAVSRLRAQARLELESLRSAQESATESAPLPRWEPVGPSPISYRPTEGPWSGLVRDIAVDPANPRKIFVATGEGGIWRSLDRGKTWRPVSDGACSLEIGSIVIDPKAPQVIYAGTGDQTSGFGFSCGLLRSTDGGESWERLLIETYLYPECQECESSINDIQIVPESAGSTETTVVWIATATGLYKSTQSGRNAAKTWPSELNDSRAVLDLVSRGEGQPEMAMATSRGFYFSSDRGLAWSLAQGGPEECWDAVLANGPNRSQKIYAACSPFGPNLLLFRSDDFGRTWSKLDPVPASGIPPDSPREIHLPYCAAQCPYDLALAVDPLNENKVYFGGVFAAFSEDGGLTWRNFGFGQNLHVDIHRLGFDPLRRMWAATDGGPFYSDDSGKTWKPSSGNLNISMFYKGVSVFSSSAVPLLIVGGTQDNGVTSTETTTAWKKIFSGDGGWSGIDSTNPNVIYAECQWPCGPYKSTDRGRSWRQVAHGINLQQVGGFIPPLVISKTSPQRLLFGVGTLYLSENGGKLWKPVIPGNCGTRALAFSERAPLTAFAHKCLFSGGGHHLDPTYFSRDGGKKWTKIVERVTFSDLVVDPENSSKAYASSPGYSEPSPIYAISASGEVESLRGDLPAVHASAVTVYTCPQGTALFLGTDLGVFRSLNRGGSWTELSEGLPNTVIVNDLVVEPRTKTLWAATYGRGIFRLDLATACQP